jgi:hypothetical protein
MNHTIPDPGRSRIAKIWRAAVSALFVGALVAPPAGAQATTQATSQAQAAPERQKVTNPLILKLVARRQALLRVGYEWNSNSWVRTHKPKHRSPNKPPKPVKPPRPGHDDDDDDGDDDRDPGPPKWSERNR